MIQVDVCKSCNYRNGVLEQTRAIFEGSGANVSYSDCLGLCSLGSGVRVTRDGKSVDYAKGYRDGVRSIDGLARDVNDARALHK